MKLTLRPRARAGAARGLEGLHLHTPAPGGTAQRAEPLAEDFFRYYLVRTRVGAAALFGVVAAALMLAPFYRNPVFGANAPGLVVAVEWALIIPACLIGAAARLYGHASRGTSALALGAIVAVGAGLIVVFWGWRLAGVAFPNEFVGLFIIAALALSGLTQAQLLPPAIAVLLVDTATAYYLDGWSTDANAHMFGNALMGLLGFVVGQHTETSMQQVWLDARRFERMAGEDPLTHLSNRRAFDIHCAAALGQAAREHRSVAIGILDLDWFKQYNDHYGHMTGDGALILIADILSHSARRPLDAVCRMGGEEFAVFWYDVGCEFAAQRAESLLQAVRNMHIPHRFSPAADRLTASIGVVCVEASSGMPLEAALAAADKQLYEAKRDGRNRAVVARLVDGETPLSVTAAASA